MTDSDRLYIIVLMPPYPIKIEGMTGNILIDLQGQKQFQFNKRKIIVSPFLCYVLLGVFFDVLTNIKKIYYD